MVKVFVVMVIAAACGKSADKHEQHGAEQAPRVPVPPPKPPASATVQLPTRDFAIADVLGKSKSDVDKALGHSEQLEDGPWLYDGFDKTAVDVVFEGDKAAFVSVTAPEFNNTEADRAAVLTWMHAPHDVDFDRTHSFDFELGIWAPGAQERQLRRRAVAQEVTDTLKPNGGYASANYTLLTVVLRAGVSCTRKTLSDLAQAHDLKSAGFEVMQCDVDGTKLKLR